MAAVSQRWSALSSDQSSSATGDDYKGGGAKKSHHGYTFQFHVLMLFALRAYNLGYQDFKLGTEVADADKLDDIVFSYCKDRSDGNGRYFRLVQTKHTQREQTLRAAQLFEDPNKDFSLRMYFNAYRKLMHSGKLLGKCDEIQDLILCTNMNFKNGDRFGDFVIGKQSFVTDGDGEGGKDRLLGNVLKRFSERFEGKERLILHLKNGAVRIPSKFAVCIISETEYKNDEDTSNSEPQLFELYENVLRDEVIDLETLKFRQSFCHCEHLSTPAKHFREELFVQFISCCNIHGEKDESKFCKFLEEAKLHVSLKALSVKGLNLDSPKQLAKRLSRILDKFRSTGIIQVVSEKSVLWKHFKSLMKFVLKERFGRITFSKEFLCEESLPGNLSEFRDILTNRIGYFGLALKDLEKYSFEIDSSMWVVAVDDVLDADVCKFLKFLRFSVNQPCIEEMEGLILEEIRTHFKETEVRNAYLRFFRMMYSWAESKAGKYLTDEDVKQFFSGIQKEFLGKIRFNLKQPVQNFTGREEQLEELRKWLHGGSQDIQVPIGRKAVISQSKAISGLGGIGKSELARKYAQIHFGVLYDNIIWIDAAGSDRMEKCFQMLAFDILGIRKENQNGDKKAFESIVWETYKFFEGKRTLFIFDNADTNADLEPYFPRLPDNEHMYIIITSRSQNWGHIDVLGLDNFTLAEAFQFITLCLDDLPEFGDNDAIELANMLNCFPLAIKQAVSYIKEMSQRMKNLGRGFTIKQYILLFEKKTREMLDYTFPRDLHNSYSQTTYKTMQIAIDYAKKSKHGDVAILLLNAMSYLSPNNIDVRILCCSYLVDYDDMELAAGLELLTRFAIATVNESMACIHRLVQLVNRVCLKDRGEEEQTLMKVLDFVLLMDVEHAIFAWDFASGYKDLMEKNVSMPLMIIAKLSDNLMVKLALQFGQRAISNLKSHLGPDHPEVIFIRRGMGRALYFEGKFEQSITIFQEVLEQLMRIFGENPDVLWTKNYIGVSLMQLGRYSEALNLFKDVLKKGQSMVEEDSKLLFSTKIQISHALGLLGNVEESLKYLEDSKNQSQKIVDEYKFLSGQYSQSEERNVFGSGVGEFHKHEELLKLELKNGLLNYGADIDILIQAYVNISMAHSVKGNFEESLKVAEEAYKLLSLKLGEKHLKCVNLKNMIALNLCNIGKIDMALNLLQEVKEIHLEAQNNLQITHTRLKIADILFSQMRYEEALKEYEEVDNDIIDLVLPEDPTRVKCKFCIAILICNMGKPKLAVSKLGEAFAILKSNSGLIHSIDELISEMEKVATFLVQKQSQKEALQAYKYIYHLRKQYKGEQHIETLESKFIFSEIYCHHKQKGSLEKGMEYLVELNTVLLSKLVEKEPRVEALMMKIYRTLIYLKQMEKAKSMMIETFKEGINILGNESQFILTLWGIILRLESCGP